ncbi:MAG: redoxin domain-containing protein [Deltaproteobacteria bacterium]|nr:redoxin domain-containing protein [Deltaproteobacteria bacterium]MBI3295070.1 redoxin domain-containing protein [Deltaproteobacteria bacterium]
MNKQIALLSLVIGQLVLAGGLEVGDTAPDVTLLGVDAKGAPIVESVRTVEREPQSYTIIQFLESGSPVSALNVSALADLSVDIGIFVATRIVAVDKDVSDVKTFIKNNKSDIRFPVHFDDRQNAMRAFGVDTLPTLFVVKDETKVIYKVTGAITPEARQQILTATGF